jgi:UDP:flavonoid glycosyltransferase YjiC (YdhE family)
MRVLITSWAWPSHYFPMVPLGWALRAAGHEVRVVSQPALADAITTSGLPAVVVGDDVDMTGSLERVFSEHAPAWVKRGRAGDGDASPGVAGPPDPEQLRAWASRCPQMHIPTTEAMLDGLLEFATAWRPDLIVYEPTTYAAPLVAAALGIPAARHLWGVDCTLGSREFEPNVLEPLVSRLGLPGVETLGAFTIDNCPPSMQLPGALGSSGAHRRQLMRYVPYNGPGVMPGWVLEPRRRARICVTWGISTTRLAPGLSDVAPVLDAISGADAEVVAALSAADCERLGRPPDGVRVVESLPLHLLLRVCDVLVHQGGPGTTMTGLACGVPQLVLPTLPFQWTTARQLTGTGAGRFVNGRDATAGVLRERIDDLLTAGHYRRAALRVRTEISRQPTPAQVAHALGELTGSAASPSPDKPPAQLRASVAGG